MRKKILVGILAVSLILGLMNFVAIGKRTITYWSEEAPTLGNDLANVLKFEALNPDVDIVREYIPAGNMAEKMMMAIVGNSTPDVVKGYQGRAGSYWYQGALESLTGTLPQVDLDDYIPSVLELCSIDGNLIGYPFPYGARNWGVNPVMLERAGVSSLVPITGDNREWYMDDFMTVAEAIGELDGVYPIAFFAKGGSGDYYTLVNFQMFGANLYEDGDHTKTTLNSDAGVEALEWMVGMVEMGLAPDGAAALCDDDFVAMKAAGKVAFGGWPRTKAQWQKNFDNGLIGYVTEDILIEPPHKKGTPAPTLFIGPDLISVCTNSSDKELAIVFAQFASNAENHKERIDPSSLLLSPRLSIEVTNPWASILQNMAIKNGIGDLGMSSPFYLEGRSLQYPELQAAFMGMKTPKEALDDFAAALSALWQ